LRDSVRTRRHVGRPWSESDSPTKREDDVDYEIEVQELKDRRRGLGRVAVGALVTCVLVLVLRHFI
jgi:hypothetical protein